MNLPSLPYFVHEVRNPSARLLLRQLHPLGTLLNEIEFGQHQQHLSYSVLYTVVLTGFSYSNRNHVNTYVQSHEKDIIDVFNEECDASV